MPREQLTHSLVRTYSTAEEMFLRGRPIGDFEPQPYWLPEGELAPLDARGYDYFGAPEFDAQHSCSHGTQRGSERPDAADRFAIALLGMAGCIGFALWYVLICGLVAVCQQIGGYLR